MNSSCAGELSFVRGLRVGRGLKVGLGCRVTHNPMLDCVLAADDELILCR
jgi:hypothetical protein